MHSMKLVASGAVIVVVAIAIAIVVWPTAKAEREVSESIAIPIVVVMASHPAVVELAASRASEGAGLASPESFVGSRRRWQLARHIGGGFCKREGRLNHAAADQSR